MAYQEKIGKRIIFFGVLFLLIVTALVLFGAAIIQKNQETRSKAAVPPFAVSEVEKEPPKAQVGIVKKSYQGPGIYQKQLLGSGGSSESEVVSADSRTILPAGIKKGYIVQFTDKPLVEYLSDLKETGKTEGKPTGSGTDDKKWAPQLKIQSEKITAVHQQFKVESQKILGKSLPVIAEFKNVFNGIALDVSPEEVEKLKRLSSVAEIYPNEEVYADTMDSVPLIGADQLWPSQAGSITGQNVTIAILDSGIDYTHPDLGGCLGPGCKVIDAYDTVWNTSEEVFDDMGHGTHVAATAAGKGDYISNNSYEPNLGEVWGVAPDAKLYSYKVLERGAGTSATVIAGIERAIDPDQNGDFSDYAKVINLSLGGAGKSCNDPLIWAVENAVSKGSVVVVAAGNSGSREYTIGRTVPAKSKKAITVGATYKKDYGEMDWDMCKDDNATKDSLTCWSSRGPIACAGISVEKIKPDIVAPGALICAARLDNIFSEDWGHPYYRPCTSDGRHVQLAGTSMSAPHVAGVAALMVQAHPNWSPDEIKYALRNTAKDLGRYLPEQGYGRVNAAAAVRLTNPPPIANIENTGKLPGAYVDVYGTATAQDFTNYTLYYVGGKKTTLTSAWQEICTSSSQISAGTLCRWDVRNLAEGWYTLRLTVRSQPPAGQLQETSDHAFVDIRTTQITQPTLNEIVPSWKNNLEIIGTSTGLNFQRYTLEWCLDEGSCSDSGVVLENNGSRAVTDKKLATWDISSVTTSNSYTLKLKTYFSGGRVAEVSTKVYIAVDLLPNWPAPIAKEEVGTPGEDKLAILDQPTVADVNNDGKKEIVTAYGRFVSVLDYNAQALNNNWPQKINTSCDSRAALLQQGPAVGNLDSDSNNEIAVGDNCGYFHLFNANGQYLPGWPKRLGDSVNAGCDYFNTAAIADVNGDTSNEIIATDWCGHVHVFDTGGNYLAGWPKRLAPPIGNFQKTLISRAPAVADIDGDGFKEIAAYISGSNSVSNFVNSCEASRIYIFKHDGTPLGGWDGKNVDNGGICPSNIVLANLDSDSQLEIIAGSNSGTLYAWNHDGSTLFTTLANIPTPIKSYPVPQPPISFIREMNEPAIGDINSDGNPEVLVTANRVMVIQRKWYRDGCLFAFSKNGVPLANFPVCKRTDVAGAGPYFYSQFTGVPQLANLDNDSAQEVIAVAASGATNPSAELPGLYALNSDGTIAAGFPKMTDSFAGGNTAAVGDLDGDSYNELVSVSSSGYIYVWDLPAGSGQDDWPNYHHDPAHTGFYPSSVVLMTPTPTPTGVVIITPTRTPTPTLLPTPTPTISKLPCNRICLRDDECATNYCWPRTGTCRNPKCLGIINNTPTCCLNPTATPVLQP